MYLLRYSSRFKKELRVYRNNKKVLAELKLVLDYLAKGHKLPKKYKNHKLIGEFKGCFECHIRPDILLVYKINEKDFLVLLLRLNSHSNLF